MDRSERLSVIITTYGAEGTVARCLESLRAQTLRDPFEILLVDSGTDATARIVRERFPEVTLLTFEDRKYCGDARNIGIQAAAGEIIAFLDADCVAAPDWAEAILSAHERHAAPLIGGVVDNGNPGDYSGWAYYFSEFAAWQPGMPEGEVGEIPGCVLSLKRWAFVRYGPFIEGTYCSDSALHWAMARDGHLPRFVPEIRISHLNPTGVARLVGHARSHGRNFGTVRAAELGMSRGRRWAHLLTAPALPFLLFARAGRSTVRAGTYVGEFVKAAPLVLMTMAAWSFGEWQGYLGAGRSARRAGADRR